MNMLSPILNFKNNLDYLSSKVLILLALAFLRVLAINSCLTFMPMYLKVYWHLDIDEIGYILGGCMFISILISVYSSYIADKFNKFYFMVVLCTILVSIFTLLALVHNLILLISLILLINICGTSINIASKALLSELLLEEDRVRIFSLRYTMENIGTVAGPFLGVFLVKYSFHALFWFNSICVSALILVLLSYRKEFPAINKFEITKVAPKSFLNTLKVLFNDKRLILFTIGGILSMTVYGPLLTYLAQYLIMIKNPYLAYKIIAYITAVNCGVVVCLQYVIGKKIKKPHLMYWLTFGILTFIIGLFMLSLSENMVIWVIAIIIFTIGEIIVMPSEYMFIDSIAPSHLKASYFGVQNLMFLGFGLGPIICGHALKHFSPKTMFYILMLVAILSWFVYYSAVRLNIKHKRLLKNGLTI